MTDAPPARWSGPRRRTTATVVPRFVVVRTPEDPDGRTIRTGGPERQDHPATPAQSPPAT